jgi:antitoxin (DNA-binding transcriptional repressor) of toxin-antitoxin stability system
MEATAKDLRLHSKEIIAGLKLGKEILLTYRGEPTAMIIPFRKKTNKSKKGEIIKLFGIWKDNKKIEDVSHFIDELRGGRFN